MAAGECATGLHPMVVRCHTAVHRAGRVTRAWSRPALRPAGGVAAQPVALSAKTRRQPAPRRACAAACRPPPPPGAFRLDLETRRRPRATQTSWATLCPLRLAAIEAFLLGARHRRPPKGSVTARHHPASHPPPPRVAIPGAHSPACPHAHPPTPPRAPHHPQDPAAPPPPVVLVPPLFERDYRGRSRMVKSSFDYAFGKPLLKWLFHDYLWPGAGARLDLRPAEDPRLVTRLRLLADKAGGVPGGE